MNGRLLVCLIGAGVVAVPAVVLGHPGGPMEHGAGSGWLHAWAGVDHWMMMLCAAVWMGLRQVGWRELWLGSLGYGLLFWIGGGAAMMAGSGLVLAVLGLGAAGWVLALYRGAGGRGRGWMAVAVLGCLHGAGHGMGGTGNGWAWLGGMAGLAVVILVGVGPVVKALASGRAGAPAARIEG